MGCVFCKKIEIPDGPIRFHGDNICSFEPLNPVVQGHRLFVPTKHFSRPDDDPIFTGFVFAEASRWAADKGDYNLIVNGGTDAGQTVFHLHVHYVPRVNADGLLLPWDKK